MKPSLKTPFLLLALLAAGDLSAQPVSSVVTNWPEVELDLMSVERKGSVLTVKWAVRNTASDRREIAFSLFGEAVSSYLVDEENGAKYYALTDRENHLLASEHEYLGSNRYGISQTLEPGATLRFWAKFPAPPPDVKVVSVFFSECEPMEGVTISDK